MFLVMETTPNHWSLEELTGLDSWEGSSVIHRVKEELGWRARSQGHDAPSVFYFCSFLIGFILQTDSLQWHRWCGRHPPASWLYNLIFSNTRGKRIFYSQHLCISPRTDSDWLSLDDTPTPLPITVSWVRELPWLIRTGSHDHSCDQEGLESVIGRREMEGQHARQPKQRSPQSIHHWTIFPSHLYLIFHFWLLCVQFYAT